MENSFRFIYPIFQEISISATKYTGFHYLNDFNYNNLLHVRRNEKSWVSLVLCYSSHYFVFVFLFLKYEIGFIFLSMKPNNCGTSSPYRFFKRGNIVGHPVSAGSSSGGGGCLNKVEWSVIKFITLQESGARPLPPTDVDSLLSKTAYIYIGAMRNTTLLYSSL